MKKQAIISMTVALMLAPLFTIAQYFQHLHDYDSTYDWSSSIFIRPDNTLFIRGSFLDSHNEWALTNMHLSTDGSTILSKRKIKFDTASLYNGMPGDAKMLPGGGYISAISIQRYIGSYNRSWAGFVKYNAAGDTVLLKTYTDTSIYFESMVACAVTANGDYLLGGFRALHANPYYPALLIRTDSLGDTLWTRTYKRMGGTATKILNIIPLADGRIVVGAISTYMADAGGIHHLTYAHNTPWFMLLDNMGNILRDTIYSDPYLVGWNICGSLYPDKNGGYIHIGNYDSLFNTFPDHANNFPSYIAHLDTNFRITWITELPFSDYYGHRQSYNVHQLQDGNFIVNGEVRREMGCGTFGWAAKIDQGGKLLWNHLYSSDTTHCAYLADMAEKPDGSLLFVGKTFNDTLPAWRANGDVWLIGVDSNGCLQPGGCDPDTTFGVTATPPGLPKREQMHVLPNPNNGAFSIMLSTTSNEPAQIVITNIVGAVVKEITTTTNKETEVKLDVPAGMYFINAGTRERRYNAKVVVTK